MERALLVAVLNELLSLEQRSLAPRLLESTVSVSSLAAPAMSLVQRMSNAVREHSGTLARLILELGGTPGRRGFGIATADLHFQDLQHVLPRLVANEEELVRDFTLAAQRISDDPRALAAVTRILQRHQQNLQALGELCPKAPSPRPIPQ